MIIEHVALFVNDLEAARDFFIKYFDGKTNDGYRNVNTGFRSYFITFEGGARLEIMNKDGIADDVKECEHMGYNHIAFSVGSKEKVDELTERLKADGYKLRKGPRTTGDGYYESSIYDMEGNSIEITV